MSTRGRLAAVPGALRPPRGGACSDTRKRYRAVRNHHLAFCVRNGIETWDAFGKPAFESYGNHRGKVAANRTLYMELTTLKAVINALIDAGQLPAACRFRSKLSKPQGTDRYCFRPEEVRAMLAHCAATPGLEWLGLVILGLAHTGMRIGELAGLRWSDLDAGLNTIRIADERASRRKKQAGTARTTKGKRSRSVPVHPRLQQALSKLDRSAGGPVFRASRGGRLRPRNVLQQFIDGVIGPLSERFPTPEGETGFADGRLHSFRHYFISQALLAGATEGEVREWVGHTDSKLIEHYRKLHAEDARRRMRTLNLLGVDADGTERNEEETATYQVATVVTRRETLEVGVEL